MRFNRFCLLLCCSFILLALVFSGCVQTPAEETSPQYTFSVVLKETISPAYVDTSYNLFSAIVEEEGVEYTFTASYLDPISGESKTLSAKRGKITPKVEADISVTVTATNGTETATLDFIVPISISADIIDKLLSSDGIAGEADPGVEKVITKDPSYLQGESSTSSIQVSFNTQNTGTSLMLLSHYSLQPYYTAQVWHNAAVTFWVYNPMEQAVSFKLSSYNPENQKTLSWGSAENVHMQSAAPGQWTQVSFSLFDMDITQPLLNSPQNNRNDSLKIMAHYEGDESCTIYIDGIDIVPASALPQLETSYISPALPNGNFSDLLSSGKVYTNESNVKLTKSANGNGTQDAYCFGSDQQVGLPTYHIDFPQTTDISGFDYLKFDVYAENCHPFVTAAVRYLNDKGEVQKLGVSYNFARDQWRTLYLNLHSLKDVDLSQAVGISFSIHLDSKFVPNSFNCIYFDNVSLYSYPDDEPQMMPAIIEDNDILNAPLYITNNKINTSGVCKVSADETGLQKSNSMLLFWANNVSGYPTATLLYETAQDWSDYNILAFETHQVNAHYWMHFEILYLDENDHQHTLSMYHDTVFNHWLTTNAPFEWFKTEDGQSAKPEHLKRVVGFRITVDFANNVTDEVGYIFFDNFELS